MEGFKLFTENNSLDKQDFSDFNIISFCVLTFASLFGSLSGIFVNGKVCIKGSDVLQGQALFKREKQLLTWEDRQKLKQKKG